MQQHALFAGARVLLADELERVVERADQRFDAGLHLAALHPHALDLALHVFDPRLSFLQQQIGAAFGLALDHRGLLRGVILDLVRHLLRA